MFSHQRGHSWQVHFQCYTCDTDSDTNCVWLRQASTQTGASCRHARSRIAQRGSRRWSCHASTAVWLENSSVLSMFCETPTQVRALYIYIYIWFNPVSSVGRDCRVKPKGQLILIPEIQILKKWSEWKFRIATENMFFLVMSLLSNDITFWHDLPPVTHIIYDIFSLKNARKWL